MYECAVPVILISRHHAPNFCGPPQISALRATTYMTQQRTCEPTCRLTIHTGGHIIQIICQNGPRPKICAGSIASEKKDKWGLGHIMQPPTSSNTASF